MNPMEMDPHELLRLAQDLPLDPLCKQHKVRLFRDLVDVGLGSLLQESLTQDAETTIAQGADLIRRVQEAGPRGGMSPEDLQSHATPANYSPLVQTLIDVLMLGISTQCSLGSCVICQLNARRPRDGRCRCEDPTCSAAKVDFEGFLTFIATRQADWARANNMVE